MDIRTLMIATAVAALASSVAVYATHLYRFHVKGTQFWALGSFCFALGLSFMAGRHHLPDILTISLANGLLISGFMFIWMGMRLFFLRPSPPWIVWLLPLLLILTFYWFSGVRPSVNTRVIIYSAIACPVNLLIARELLSGATRRDQARLVAATVFLADALLILVTGLGMLFAPKYASYLATGPFIAATYLGSMVIIVLYTFAVVMLIGESLQARLERQAVIDPLTGIYNRRAYQMFSRHDFSRIKRSSRSMSLLMMDLDHFKEVNDRLGHAAGDALLVHFVETVSEQIREEDLMFRIGGEEFVVLLPDTDLAGAGLQAERIRKVFEESPLMIGGASVQGTVSIGVAQSETSDPGAEQTMQRADKALYEAKRQGRNRVAASIR